MTDNQDHETSFERVGNLFPDAYELECLEADVPVSEALDRMAFHRFAQMPVIEGDRLVGVFSFWSLTEHLRREPRPDLDALYVGDLVEQLPRVTVDDDLYRVLQLLQQHEALLVGTPRELQAITTAWDVLDYFYRVARPYLLLREIELSLRLVIDGCLDNYQLQAAVQVTIAKKYENQDRPPPAALDEMSFADYVNLIGSDANWQYFDGVLGKSRVFIQARLGLVAQIRNQVFHFRENGLSVRDFETLVAERERLLVALDRLARRTET